MSKLVGFLHRNTSQLIDEGIYQMFGHFVLTSILLLVVFAGIGIAIGSLLLAFAVGSFIWALLAVACVKYCELIANQHGGLQL